MAKPKCKVTGTNGNVFNLIGLVSRSLRNAGLNDKAEEFVDKAFKAGSYDEAIQIMMEYVDVY